jgi:hypothetical protein
LSNETYLLVRAAEILLAALRIFNAEAKPFLQKLYAVLGPDDDMSDMDRDADLLEVTIESTKMADKERDDAAEAGVQKRVYRDASAEALRGSVRALDNDVSSNNGRQYRRLYGIKAPERDARKLIGQCTGIRDRLLDESIESPPTRRGGEEVKRSQHAADLTAKIKKTDTSITAMDTAKKFADQAVIKKRTANKHLRRVYLYVARRSEAAYRMVGKDDLANKLREVRRTRIAPQGTPAAVTPDTVTPDTVTPDTVVTVPDTSTPATPAVVLAGASDEGTEASDTFTV